MLDDITEIAGTKLIPFHEVLFVFKRGRKGFDYFIEQFKKSFVHEKGFTNDYGFFHRFNLTEWGTMSRIVRFFSRMYKERVLTNDYSRTIICRVLCRIIDFPFEEIHNNIFNVGLCREAGVKKPKK